ncbi:Azr1p [Saccharomyces cerevisiae YJM1400]|nr:Azr1p [Saccharomyces cerevisiae YJM1479]AJS28974.1 Azr1p [Saccharomyces cerevisiae YJM1400]
MKGEPKTYSMSDLSYYGEKAQQQNEKQQKQYVVRRNSTQSTSKQNVSVVLEDNASESNELPKGFILYASLIALALSLFLAALDIMIVSTIIEEVAKQFGSYSEIGWLFTGYSLPNALLALIWGRIATPIGFKETMLFAIVIFEIGSLISALANSMSMLIGGRVIAGVGGCGIQSLSFVIGSTLVEESQRGILIAVLSCSFAIASVVGPFLGGVFTSSVTWRWCFYVNLPIGGLAFFLFLFFYNPGLSTFQETMDNIRKFPSQFIEIVRNVAYHLLKIKGFSKLNGWRKLFMELIFMYDIIEFVFCSAGFTCILLAFTFGGNRYAWNSASIIILFIIGIVLVVLAGIYDFLVFPKFNIVKATPHYQPLMSWTNIKKPGIFTVNIALFLTCAGYISQFTYIVQYFQLIYNDSAWRAAVHLVACIISTVVTAILCGVITDKTRQIKPIIVISSIFGVVGAGILTLLNNNANNSAHIGLLILPGVAFGGLAQSSMLASQIQLDKKSPTFRSDFVSITTFNTFCKNLGQALGGVISNTVFSAAAIKKLTKANIQLPDGNTVDNLVIYRQTNFDGSHSKLGNIISESLTDVFYMALGFYALSLIFAVFASNKKVTASLR